MFGLVAPLPESSVDVPEEADPVAEAHAVALSVVHAGKGIVKAFDPILQRLICLSMGFFHWTGYI